MLFEEIISGLCDQKEHTDTLCGQNARFHDVASGGRYRLLNSVLQNVKRFVP